MMAGPAEEELEEQYAAIFHSLPAVDYAFAYGSGVFKQAGNDETHGAGQQTRSAVDGARLPMLDLLLAVTSPTEWHAANLQRNPGHYSVLRWLGAGTIARIQGAWTGHDDLCGVDLCGLSKGVAFCRSD